MLTYSFEDRGEESLYGHLYRCIRRDIESGAIPAYAKLPSKRAFAQHLGVSLITAVSYTHLDVYKRQEHADGRVGHGLEAQVGEALLQNG